MEPQNLEWGWTERLNTHFETMPPTELQNPTVYTTLRGTKALIRNPDWWEQDCRTKTASGKPVPWDHPDATTFPLPHAMHAYHFAFRELNDKLDFIALSRRAENAIVTLTDLIVGGPRPLMINRRSILAKYSMVAGHAQIMKLLDAAMAVAQKSEATFTPSILKCSEIGQSTVDEILLKNLVSKGP